jgi:TonB-dependent SusC/RagA subfamily outer membrane receptor
MEENKLFNQIRLAAENAETKEFPGMEKVWQRVEEKLDHKEDKKAVWRWKKIAVAASLLLVATLGYQFFKTDQTDIKPSKAVSINDSIKNPITKPNEIVTTKPLNPEIKKDAEQILLKQITPSTQVVMGAKAEMRSTLITDSIASGQTYFTAPTPATTQTESHSKSNFVFENKKADYKDVEMLMDGKSKVSTAQKEEPLVVIDDKVSKKGLKDHVFDDTEELVVLKEPLYIINGVEYTEQEVFGPNPTSPYTPLNKQEIESISVLQDEKAIEIYGNKGKKGVVIITTKNGKPVSASKKAK